MACQFSPSLCTAAAKGDTATVEKHLQAQCCNPSATQYFINPHEDPHSPLAIVGMVRRKRNVTVMPKNNGEHGALVKPASPLQVALYYKEEGVLFLLLNHFLKICAGNVARCYDETAEAIATTNGYSHLMDFFQYYDSISKDSFGACWTEAMRHICDLTTKLNKYRKHNAELLQERDQAMKGRDQACLERDALAKDHSVNSKTLAEQKDALIHRLQHALAEKDAVIKDLQLQADSLRESVNAITGAGALDRLQAATWAVVADPNGGDAVAVRRLEDGEEAAEVMPAASPIRPSDGGKAPFAAPPSGAAISDCMRHQAALDIRLAHLREYALQCRAQNARQRGHTQARVEAVAQQCQWDQLGSAPPDLPALCPLTLGTPELQVFEYGADAERVAGIIRQLEVSQALNPSSVFGEVARQQAETAVRIRDLLHAHHISSESSVHTLDVLMGHLEKLFVSQTVEEAVADTRRRVQVIEAQILQATDEKQRCELAGSVTAVERELLRQLEGQRQLLDVLQTQLRQLGGKAEELQGLSGLGALCGTALEDVREVIARRGTLAGQCEADRATLQGLLDTRRPELQLHQATVAVAGEAFTGALQRNDAGQVAQWDAIVAALEELHRLQEARTVLIQDRLEALMRLKRREAEYEALRGAVEHHMRQLADVGAKCKVSSEIGQLICDMVEFGQGTVQSWLQSAEAELELLTLAAHQQMYERFRDWYLAQGEYAHKKKMLLRDVTRKIAETDNRKQLAIQRLDSAAQQHGELLNQLEQQRMDLELHQLPRVETAAVAALPLLEPTQAYLTARGLPFTHPEGELRQRNERREIDLHMREVSKYQELILASQRSLTECSVGLPEAERVLLLENHRRIEETRCRLAVSGRGEGSGQADTPEDVIMSELEENRALKQQLQEACVLIPLEFLDPITLEIIADPVLAPDGHTYERTSILRWLQRKGTSPRTGEAMDPAAKLTPNTALKDALQTWRIQQLEALDSPPTPKTVSGPGKNEGAEPPAGAPLPA